MRFLTPTGTTRGLLPRRTYNRTTVSPPSTPRGWGRGPLVAAGVAIAGLLGALASLVLGFASREELTGALFAAGLITLALAALAVLAVLLTLDRFPRTVLDRLAALEARLEDGAGAVPSPSSPPEATIAAARRAQPATAEPPAPPPTPPEPDLAPAPAVARPEQPPAAPPAIPPPPPRPRPSLELLLGGRALAIAGAVVLVVAVGLLVKYGWDRGWFRPSPAARVAIGVGIGLALLGLGEAARRASRYLALGQVLTAGGVGALYVSAWAAHGLYELVPAATAFLLLAAAAALGVAVATATGGRVVAWLSTVGGLVVPWVVDLGPRPPTMLYGYLLVLLAAVLAVSAVRRWPELGAVALLGTAALVVAAFEWRWPQQAGRYVDAGFLLAAATVFFAITLAFAWRRRAAPGRFELVVLAVASLGAWAAGLIRLDPLGPAVGGAWTVALLLVELIAAHVLLLRLGAGAQGRRLFLGLALLLLTALPPVLWSSAGVAAAWSVEALVLALAVRVSAGGHAAALVALMAAGAAEVAAEAATRDLALGGWHSPLRLAAAVVLGALLVIVERRRAAGDAPALSLQLVAAPAAALAALACAIPELESWAAATVAPRLAGGLAEVGIGLTLALLGGLLLAAWSWPPLTMTFAVGATLIAGSLLWDGTGVTALAGWRSPATAAPLLWAAAAVAVLALRTGGRARSLELWTVGCGAVAVAAVAVPRLGSAWPGVDAMRGAAAPGVIGAAAAGLLLLAAAIGRGWQERVAARTAEIAGWVVMVAASSRVLASAVALADGSPDSESRRLAVVALSVLWGAAGLAAVLAGLVGGAAHRRYLGLALLALTLAKVFFVDLAAAPTLLRIVAFLVTGLALLAGAFLYARYQERVEGGR